MGRREHALLAVSVGLLAGAALAYQVLLFRLLAIVQWHTFVATIVSLALLGHGAAGTALALAGKRLLPRFQLILCGLGGTLRRLSARVLGAGAAIAVQWARACVEPAATRLARGLLPAAVIAILLRRMLLRARIHARARADRRALCRGPDRRGTRRRNCDRPPVPAAGGNSASHRRHRGRSRCRAPVRTQDGAPRVAGSGVDRNRAPAAVMARAANHRVQGAAARPVRHRRTDRGGALESLRSSHHGPQQNGPVPARTRTQPRRDLGNSGAARCLHGRRCDDRVDRVGRAS